MIMALYIQLCSSQNNVIKVGVWIALKKFFYTTISTSRILDRQTEYCRNKSLNYSQLWLKHLKCTCTITANL